MGFGIYTGGTTGLTDGTLVSASNKLTFPSITTVLDAHIRCGTDEYSTQIDFNDIPLELEISFNAGGVWYGIGAAPFYAATSQGPGNSDVWDVNYPIKLRQVAVPVTADDTFTTDGTVSACTALSTPTLTATVISSSQIDLSWTNVANEDGYTIERSPNGSSWSALTTKAANVTTHSDTGLSSWTQYYYRVKAEGSGRYSDSGWGSDDATTDAATFLDDTFTEGSDTVLSSHSADVGGSGWTAHTTDFGGTGGTSPLVYAAGDELYGRYSGGNSIFYHTATPPSANQDVRGHFVRRGAYNTGQGWRLYARMSTTATGGVIDEAYMAIIANNHASGVRVTLLKYHTHSLSVIGSESSAIAMSTSAITIFRLRAQGTSITVDYSTDGGSNWTSVHSVTDSDVTAAGKVGLAVTDMAASATSGINMDRFVALA